MPCFVAIGQDFGQLCIWKRQTEGNPRTLYNLEAKASSHKGRGGASLIHEGLLSPLKLIRNVKVPLKWPKCLNFHTIHQILKPPGGAFQTLLCHSIWFDQNIIHAKFCCNPSSFWATLFVKTSERRVAPNIKGHFATCRGGDFTP